MVGSVTAKDGLKAQVVDDAAITESLNAQAFITPGLVTEPAECLARLRSGALSDYRVPTAVGILGPPGGVSSLQVSYEDSGLYWEAMHDISYSIAHCSPISMITAEATVGYALNPVPADLHGTKTIAVVATLTAPDGSQAHILRYIAMAGNLFVSAETSIPGPYPEDSTRDELTGYVNAIIDHAEAVPNSPDPTSPAPAGIDA